MKKRYRTWLAALLAITMMAPVSVPASSLEEPIIEEESIYDEAASEEAAEEEPLIDEEGEILDEEEPILEEEEILTENEEAVEEDLPMDSSEEEKAEVVCKTMSPTELSEYVQEQDEMLDPVTGSGEEVDAAFDNARLLVATQKLTDSYGASDIVKYDDLDMYVLQYDTPAQAAEAYDVIIRELGEDSCFADEKLNEDQLMFFSPEYYPTYDENSGNVYSWGSGYMEMDQLRGDEYVPDTDVTVAVIDTGMDIDHFMFRNRKISSNCYNFETNQKGKAYMTDTEEGHGTHVASIISDAVPANVTILPLRISFGKDDTSDLISAIDYAIGQGAGVINMSLCTGKKTAMETVLKKAYDKNIICCASSGNGGQNVVLYPACSKYTIGVGAIGYAVDGSSNDKIASYSHYGPEVDFAAPGSDILGADAGGDLVSMTGTSMSTPEISAAFIYLKMYYPNESFSALKTRMQKLCVDLGDAGRDDYFGYGCPKMSKLKKSLHKHSFKYTSSGDTMHKMVCSTCGYSMKGQCKSYELLDSGVFKCDKCGRKLVSKAKIGSSSVAVSVDLDDQALLDFSGLSNAIRKSNQYVGYDVTVKLEEGYTKLPSYAFAKNNLITEVIFPASMTEIGCGAMRSMYNLKRVDLSKTKVTKIGIDAFRYEDHLEEILVPSTLQEVYGGAFSECKILTSMDLSGTKLTAISDSLFRADRKLRKVMLPSTVELMDWLVFVWCEDLTYVNLEDTKITQIAMNTFSGCTSLKNIILPSTLELVGSSLFDDCTALESITYLGKAPTFVESDAYAGDIYGKVNATIYYPSELGSWRTIANNPSKYQYGGNVTYKSFNEYTYIPGFRVSVSKKKYYTGSGIKPSVTLTNPSGTKLVKGTDYTLSYSDNKKLGIGGVVIQGIGAYSGTREVLFNIVRAPIKTLTLNKTSFTYDGEAHYPTATVKTAAETIMSQKSKSNSAVTLTNSLKNKKPGTYTVKAVGEGNYTGSLKKTYKIKVKSTSLGTLSGGKGSLTVKWTALPSKNVSGYQVQYTSSKTKIKNNKGHLVKVKGASAASKTITGLSKGTEYIKIRTYVTISGKTYYSSWSDYKSVKVK